MGVVLVLGLPRFERQNAAEAAPEAADYGHRIVHMRDGRVVLGEYG